MARGSKPGERRGGRKAGVPNKATREIRDIAQSYGEKAIREAGRLMTNAETEPARIAAINIILDRAYGRPAQAVKHEGAIGTYDASKLAELSDDQLKAFYAILTVLAPSTAADGGAASGDGEAGS